MALIKFFKGATAPTTIETGNIWFDTTTNSIKVKTEAGYDVFGIGLKNATLADSVLTITKSDNSTVTVDFSDIASASSVVDALALKADKTYVDTELDTKVDKVSGKGLSTNDYTNIEKNKLAGIATGAQVNVIETVKVNGVALTPDASKAVNVSVPAATVTGVASADKVLSLTNKEISTTLGLTYDSTNKKIKLTGKNSAEIASIDATSFIKDGMLESAELKVATSSAPVDGNTSGTFLVLTFNTEAESDPIYVDVTTLIDVYTAGNGITITGKSIAINTTTVNNLITTKINALDKSDTAVAGQVVSAVSETDGIITVSRRALVAADIPTLSVAKLSDLDATKVDLSTAYAAATTYAAPAAGDTVEVAIGKLTKGVADAKAAGVTSFASQTGAITVDTATTTNGQVKFSMSAKQLKGTVNGLKSAAYTESSAYATAAQGTKADSAIQYVYTTNSNNTYIALAAQKSENIVTIIPSTTIQAVSSASASVKGLAEASDVKAYVDSAVSSALTWEEFL